MNNKILLLFSKGIKQAQFLFQLIKTEVEDIDRYIFEVWGYCDDGCSLKKEYEELMAASEAKASKNSGIKDFDKD